MKLKLKHLSAYLPYKMSCIVEGYSKPLPMISAYDDGQNEYGCGAALQETSGNDFGFNSDEFKLILKPLSLLTKEFESNKEKTIPIIELCKIEDKNFNRVLRIDTSVDGSEIYYIDNDGEKYYFGYRTEYNSFYFQNKHKQHIEILHSYNLYQKLYELHFDTFGLIESGLAVNFNLL